ncbi:MAG: translation initiation factor IF-2 subunit alpha [Methanocellales archaeon]|nr:translation initiation factor IF-2 subunit alpha [Methanocellales archaeon]
MKRKEYPERGDLAVCTVVKVADFGAFVKLDEYGEKEGMIHISEVASGWIKYIRDHIKEGQKIVCKVLEVVPNRDRIDLSLKDVNAHQRREKIQQWKNEQKAEKWLDFVAESTGVNIDKLYDVIGDKLLEEFGSLYVAFEEAAIKGPDALTGASISREYADAITKVAKENVKIGRVNITGYVDLTCPLPDGITVIKKALKAAGKIDIVDVELDIIYMGAPRYMINVTAPDYKKAENALRKAAEVAVKVVERADGAGKFYRQLSEAT